MNPITSFAVHGGESIVLGPSISPILPGQTNTPPQPTTSPERRPEPEMRPEDAFEAWKSRALVEAATSEAAARESLTPSSLARAAQVLLGAGQRSRAHEHAQRALQMMATRESEFDLAATVASVQVLVMCGELDNAMEYLVALPPHPMLIRHRAAALAVKGEGDAALALLESIPADEPGVQSLIGYLHLQQGDIHKAIHQLRIATRTCPSDIEANMNLAFALRRTGSSKKALVAASRAWSLAPGRKDVAYTYLSFLSEAERWAAFERTLDELSDTTLAGESQFLLMRAKGWLHAGESDRARKWLSKAKVAAEHEGDGKVADETAGHIAYLDFVADKTSRRDARRELARLASRNPTSMALFEMLVRTSARRSESTAFQPTLEQMPDEVASTWPGIRALQIRIAYLNCDFSAGLRLGRDWFHSDRHNALAMYAFTAFAGHADGDWETAARYAAWCHARRPADEEISNSAAYALAMAGRINEARAVITSSDLSSYYLKATAGLVEICAGNYSEGFRNYRKAFEQAEATPDREARHRDTLVMYLHQALVLRHLGMSTAPDVAIQASALAPVPLPEDWSDIPAVLFVKQTFDREAWQWPPQSWQ